MRSCDPTSVLHRLGDLADALLCRSFCYLASNQDPGGYEDESPFPQQNHWFRQISSCIWMFWVLENTLGFLQVRTSPYVEWYQVMFEALKWPKLMVVEHPPNRARSGSLGPAHQRYYQFVYFRFYSMDNWYFDYPFCSKRLSRYPCQNKLQSFLFKPLPFLIDSCCR